MIGAKYFRYDVDVVDFELENTSLILARTDASNIETGVSWAPTIHFTKGADAHKFFYVGTTYDDTPEYTFTAFYDHETITEFNEQIKNIKSSLLGKDSFRDIAFYRYNSNGAEEVLFEGYAIFTSINTIYVNGVARGLEFTIRLNSPFCSTESSSNQQILSPASSVVAEFSNETVVSVISPTIRFNVPYESEAERDNFLGGTITIKDITDSNEGITLMKINDLRIGEQIIVDNELKMIDTSSTFNNHVRFNVDRWIKVKKGKTKKIKIELEQVNNIEITTEISVNKYDYITI